MGIPRKGNPDYIKNPLTGNYVKKGSSSHKRVQEILLRTKGNIKKAKNLYIKEAYVRPGKHAGLSQDVFCGPPCGYKPRSFPVSTEKECRAALSYARYASNPECIRRCALKKAKEHEWRCGVTYSSTRK